MITPRLVNLDEALAAQTTSRRFKLVLQALTNACEALAHAHNKGEFHGAITQEKILFSPQTQHFTLAHFPVPLLPHRNTDATTEASRLGAGQKDLTDLGNVFGCLLSNVCAPWLEKILDRCKNRGFADAGELLRAIAAYLEPEEAPLIVLTANHDGDKQKIDYDLAIGGSRCPEKLAVGVKHRWISALYTKWDLLGELALKRAESNPNDRFIDDIDRRIRALLGEVTEDETHRVLGPTVRRKLEAHLQAALWFRYDPSLSPVPWELLEMHGSRVCRQFQVARSPRLVSGAERHALPKGKMIRFLFIEDPDGDLPGAQEECSRLREVIQNSPLTNRIRVSIVGKSSDPTLVDRHILHSDIIHFAGHGRFDKKYTEDSGLRLGGDDVLTAGELQDFWREDVPLLFFANACDSGRTGQEASRQRVYCDAATGLGQAFLAAGIGNYVGTLWKAPDGGATIDFAVEFYRWFLSGCTVSRAIRAARDLCAQKYGEADLTWARYVLFGNPLSRIKI